MQAVAMALDAGLVVLRNGGSTAAADRAFANVLRGQGVDGIRATWRLDFVVVEDGSAVVRRVGPIGVNLSRASEAMALAERMAQREIAAKDFGVELQRIARLPSPYGPWTTIGAAACAGGFFSQVAGGDARSLGIAFVAAGTGQIVRTRLQAAKLAVAPVTLACGVVSALVAGAALRFGLSDTRAPTLIASIIYLVPGMPLINGFIDLVSHTHLFVGVERMLNAAFLFLVLAIAIAFAATLLL